MRLVTLFAAALLAGCSTASQPVSTAGKAVSGTVTFAAKTAASATDTAFRVAKTGATATGRIASSTASASVKVAQAPFVIFKDQRSGRTQQIPWEKGMTLASAGRLARMSPPVATFQVLRGQEILKGNPQLSLKPGDIVERLAGTVSAGSL